PTSRTGRIAGRWWPVWPQSWIAIRRSGRRLTGEPTTARERTGLYSASQRLPANFPTERRPIYARQIGPDDTAELTFRRGRGRETGPSDRVLLGVWMRAGEAGLTPEQPL